jgi:hypothetical protein
MKITKSQLKQLIKEELEVILTNEEAGEMFGEEVQAQLEEQDLNEMDDPAMLASMLDPQTIEALKVIAAASAKVGKELLAPTALAALAGMGIRRGMGHKDDLADELGG